MPPGIEAEIKDNAEAQRTRRSAENHGRGQKKKKKSRSLAALRITHY
jgi:hypothetical protein